MDIGLKQTALHEQHLALGARMVEYAGWSMPVMYDGILQEARAVRNAVGIFDISHMGRIRVSGDGATAFLQYVTSNDVEALARSEAQYSLLTNLEGGIIDDIIVYREDHEAYLVVINAGNTDKDLAWLHERLTHGVLIDDYTVKTAMIAVQGPQAPTLVARLAADVNLLNLKRFQYRSGRIGQANVIFCRTGYTGEDGFELIVPAEAAAEIWNGMLQAGAAPCGLGARDALRIEAGYPLYGHEIDANSTPVEAGLMWVVKLNKGSFIGRDAILAVKAAGPSRKLMGLVSEDRIQPRQGYTVYSDNEVVGEITSGVFSPTRNRSLAMGYIQTPYAKVGYEVSIAIRDKRSRAFIVQKKALLTG